MLGRGTGLALIAALLAVAAGAAEPRTMEYRPGTGAEARQWQEELRARLFDLLKLDALRAATVPLDAEIVDTEERDGLVFESLRLRASPGRMFDAVAAHRPGLKDPAPAVVAIHGHGGNRWTPFDPEKKQYKQFGTELARRGFFVISTDVGQHEVYEDGMLLMGERLWDLMRCVDYLVSRPEADANRIGCAGLSLGGEMAMWLGAMDTRVAATVSAGFLTRMDQMEQNHCMCWKFDGLRELVDFADIYALIAPHPLQCQNGEQEPPTAFTPALAREALADIARTYRDFDAPERLELVVHPGGHEVALESLLEFLGGHLEQR